jgi:RNA polymerase sigma-70 factor (ECF subfamily)
MTSPPTTLLSDWDLVTATQHGDPDAFGELWSRHVDMVYKYALSRVGKRYAEDLTADTFVHALRAIRDHKVRDQGNACRAWLITIAKHRVFDLTKSSRYRLDRPTDDLPTITVADHANTVVDHLTLRDTRSRLLELITHLSPEQRECVHLRFFSGLSVADTAVVMGKAGSAVKALQHRAVRRLAELLPKDLHR